jgi:DNA-binding NarL/FixJ family response regulator
LVVDDYEPWRRFVSSTLQKSSAIHVVSEASDGIGAVQKAEELQPDLILLDIGLPELNGIEAARRIRTLSPESKIIFITENRAPEIASEALRTGGSGYLVKSAAGHELFNAIDTVLDGGRFVTNGLAGLLEEDEQFASHAHTEKIVPQHNGNGKMHHEVGFYADDAALVDGFARGIKAALQAGNPVIVIATQPHRAAIRERLQADHVDINAATENGSYRALDSRDTLSAIMEGQIPASALCAKLVGALVSQAVSSAPGAHQRVAIFGECAPILVAANKVDAAIRLEHLWDEVTKTCQANTLCAYLWGAFPEGRNSPAFKQICAEHAVVHGVNLALVNDR